MFSPVAFFLYSLWKKKVNSYLHKQLEDEQENIDSS